METIKVFSLHDIRKEIKRWEKEYPQLIIQKCDCPYPDCYVIYRYDTEELLLYPIDALIDALKGFMEGFTKKDFPKERILQPLDFEFTVLQSKDGELSLKEENQKLREVILDLMRKNEKLLVENVTMKAQLKLQGSD